MIRSPSSPMLKMLQRRLSHSRADGVSDQELVRRFLAEQAFEAIVRRHGATVREVCGITIEFLNVKHGPCGRLPT